jgi:hypothetical protein
MDSPSQTFPRARMPYPPQPPKQPRFAAARQWLRSPTGRIVLPIGAFLAGITLVLLYALFIAGNVQPLAVPASPDSDAITAQVSYSYIAELVQKRLSDVGMPGTIQNVQVSSTQDGLLTITGDDRISALLLPVTKHFTFVVQPYTSSCVLQIHVVDAKVGGIGVTGLASTFEDSINQELQTKDTSLPKGFTYCAIGVHTQPQQLVIVYSATPIPS